MFPINQASYHNELTYLTSFEAENIIATGAGQLELLPTRTCTLPLVPKFQFFSIFFFKVNMYCKPVANSSNTWTASLYGLFR